MTEAELLHVDGAASPAEAAGRLRAIADLIERGEIALADQQVSVPDELLLEVEYETEQRDDSPAVAYELEIEVEWPVDDEDESLSRAATVAQLRSLADQIESTSFTLGDQLVVLPSEVHVKVEYDHDEEDEGSFEIELELSWERSEEPASTVGAPQFAGGETV